MKRLAVLAAALTVALGAGVGAWAMTRTDVVHTHWVETLHPPGFVNLCKLTDVHDAGSLATYAGVGGRWLKLSPTAGNAEAVVAAANEACD